MTPIPSLPNYAIDESGDVWSLPRRARMVSRSGRETTRQTKLRRLTKTPAGYVYIQRNGGGAMVHIQRIKNELAHGKPVFTTSPTN